MMQDYNLKDFKNLLTSRFEKFSNAVKNNDLSEATFPRTGDVAMVEIITRAEVLQWVIEMLPEE